MPIMMGMLALPDPGRGRGPGRQVPRPRELLPRARRAPARGRGRRPAPRGVRGGGHFAQLDGCWRSRSPTTRCSPRRPLRQDWTSTAGRPDCAPWSSPTSVPDMAAYRDVLRDEVLAAGPPRRQVRPELAAGRRRAYAATLRNYTTTTKTAQEIHDIGLAQIEKLADEYRGLGPEVVGTDDLSRSSRPCARTPSCTSPPVTSWWRPPRSRCSVRGTPCRSGSRSSRRRRVRVQPTTTGAKAFYFPPAGDGSRGGTFFVNVSDPASWGTFELQSMAFHEGIPGHHLQLAIASELRRAGVPQAHPQLGVRRGWGLYTERLSDEMGLYNSAVDRMGMFSADSMRACRLVVDTGLHALGWSREQAVEYMVANSPLAEGGPTGDRPLHRQPGTGDVVHGRPAGDPADARRGRAAAG